MDSGVCFINASDFFPILKIKIDKQIGQLPIWFGYWTVNAVSRRFSPQKSRDKAQIEKKNQEAAAQSEEEK